MKFFCTRDLNCCLGSTDHLIKPNSIARGGFVSDIGEVVDVDVGKEETYAASSCQGLTLQHSYLSQFFFGLSNHSIGHRYQRYGSLQGAP